MAGPMIPMQMGMPAQAPMTGPGQGPFVLRTDAKTELGFREVEIIRKRIQRAIRAKKDLGLIDSWTQMLAYYENRYYKLLPTTHQVAANWIFSKCRELSAGLYFQGPTLFMRGQSDRGRLVAPVMEDVFPLEREIMDSSKTENDCLDDALLLGCAFAKHGYNAEVSLDLPLRQQRGMGTPGMEAGRYGDPLMEMLGGNAYGGDPLTDLLGADADSDDFQMMRGPLTEIDPRVNYGHPWTKRVRPWHVMIDPDAKEWPEWRWIAHRYSRPYIDMKEDSRLVASARAKLAPAGKYGYFDDGDIGRLDAMTARAASEDASACICYEYYDRSANRVVTICDPVDEPVLDKEHRYFGKLTAWERLVFYEANMHPYGLSLCSQFRAQAEALNLLRTQMMEHFQTFGQTRMAYLKDRIGSDVVTKINSGDCPKAIAIDSSVEDINKVFQTLQRTPISADAWQLQELFRGDMIEVSGTVELSQARAETATKSLQIKEHEGLRIDKMRSSFEIFIEGSSRRVLKLLKNFWGPGRYTPIVDNDGEVAAMEWLSGDDVASDYDVFIEPGSTQRVDSVVRAKQIIDALPALEKLDLLMQRQGAGLDFIEVSKEFLRTVRLARNPERFIVPLAAMQMQYQQAMAGMMPAQPGMQAQTPNGLALPSPQGGVPMPLQQGQMPMETQAGIEGRLASENFAGGAM